MRSFLNLVLILALAEVAARADAPEYHAQPIFLPEAKHNHASCILALTDGTLLATWYSGSGERKSDDVEIQGAWKVPGRERWGPRFLMADTPGYPDCNPALFHSSTGIWLFWPTILDHRWEGALLKFKMATQVTPMRPISWSRSGVIHVTPDSKAFEAVITQSMATLSKAERNKHAEELGPFVARSKDMLYQRLGWMPRVHPIEIPENLEEKHPGRWILPLYCDTFSTSIMAYSDDQGETWKTGRPMVGFGNIQPSLVRKRDGTFVAYMRDNGPHRRIRLSTSTDDGETWTPAEDTNLPNPGAGIEVQRLGSGAWALVYNDTEAGRHSLAVSLSPDEGASWPWTRHLERRERGGGSFHYPSITQHWDRSKSNYADMPIHVSYTHNVPGKGSTIKHASFNEAWVRAGDQPPR
jgi:predicted neuraminidase